MTPTDQVQKRERRHADPPGIWIAVLLASVAIHVYAFGLLRLLLKEGVPGLPLGQDPVPVELITVESQPLSPAQVQPTQPLNSPTTSQPTPINPPPNPNQSADEGLNRQADSVPNAPLNDTNSDSPNPSQEQPSNSATAPTSPNPAPNPNTSPDTSVSPPIDPNPALNPNPSPDTPVVPPVSPNPSQPGGGGLLVRGLGFNRSIPDRDIPTQEATPKFSWNQEFAANEYVSQVAGNLNQTLVLQIWLIIDRNGRPTLQSAKVSQGSSPVEPTELAQAMMQNWHFEPAYMGEGAVDQEYLVTLSISPRSN